MSNVILLQKKILKAFTFNEARTIFDEYISLQPPREEILQLLKYLEHKVETPIDVTIVANFYKHLNSYDDLQKFLNVCAFQDDNTVKNLKISVEKKLGHYNTALDLCNTLPENDFINLTQKASMLKKTGDFKKAREIIEQVLIANMSEHPLKTYVSIILCLTKNNNCAIKLCIPDLAKDICKKEDISKNSVKRFFQLLIEYEHNLKNKRAEDITRKIYKCYQHYIGESGQYNIVPPKTPS